MTIDQLEDRWGVPVRTGSERALEAFERAVHELVVLAGDPVGSAEACVAADEGCSLGHLVLAYLNCYAMSPAGVRAAVASCAAASGRPIEAGGREDCHLRAALAWAGGEWGEAAHWLERALELHPWDLLALKVGQDLAFFMGDRDRLLAVVAGVVDHWPIGSVGWGYVRAMEAFGLEEHARYGPAEDLARTALGADAADVWAVHALAHVLEMQGRAHEGIEFLTASAADWSSSFFAVHNWWHRALYHLELGEIDAALALYDGPVRSGGAEQWLNAVDAASLLWRIALCGGVVGGRAGALADDVELLVDDPVSCFDDWHAVMALGLAGRHAAAADVVAASRERAHGTNKAALATAGLAVMEGFAEFAGGRFSLAADRLGEARAHALVVGGSNAQRDVIDLTLLAAAARADDEPLVASLVAERERLRPTAGDAARRLVAANHR